MTNLYITADVVGLESGGGKVTAHESEALKELGPCAVWGREQLSVRYNGEPFGPGAEPWVWDERAWCKKAEFIDSKPGVAHFYAGTFSKTVQHLKECSYRVAYTAAAHDVQKSKQAHEELGVPYDYPHLTDPVQWQRYLSGYKAADVLICPSQHSAAVMRGFGCTNRIEVIPHGCNLPICRNCNGFGGFTKAPPDNDEQDEGLCNDCEGTCIAPIAQLPPQFRIGYLGAMGCDKGVIDLLRAWHKLNYPVSEAALIIGGRDSKHPFVEQLVKVAYGDVRGMVEVDDGHAYIHLCTAERRAALSLQGWLNNVGDFYNACSLYVQPSRTEGFGIEVLESMAHGRAVICSDGAGAADVLECGMTYPAGDVDALARNIDLCYQNWKLGGAAFLQMGQTNRVLAKRYEWSKIRARYVTLWQQLLKE